MSKRKGVYIWCKACNGTGQSRYYEYRSCDVCDGRGTIESYVELQVADAFTPPDPFSRKV